MNPKHRSINYKALLFGMVCLILGVSVGVLLVSNIPLRAILIGALAEQSPQDRASGLAAIAQMLQAYFFFLILGAAVFALGYQMKHLAEMRQAQDFEIAVKLDDWIHSPEADAERRFVITALPASPDSEALRDRARTVWDRLQRVARWANQRDQSFIDVESIMDKDGDIFVKSWDLLEPYIEQARREREGKSDKYYYQKDFQEFAYKCAVYLKNNHHHIFEKIRAESRAPSRWLEKIAAEDASSESKQKAEGTGQ